MRIFKIFHFTLFYFFTFFSKNSCNDTNAQNIFIDNLLKVYGNNETLTVSQLGTLIETLTSTNEATHHEPIEDCTDLSSTECLTSKCLSVDEILEVNNLQNTSLIDKSGLAGLSPTLIHQAQKHCKGPHEKASLRKPKPAEVWGYGVLTVTIINACALTGVCFVPVMRHRYYRRFLMFMVALAVGVLTGSSLLFLIPEAFNLYEDERNAEMYMWKSTTIIAGIFLFFVLERILKMIMDWRQSIDKEKMGNELPVCSVHARTPHENEPHMKVHLSVSEENEESYTRLVHSSPTDASLATTTTLVDPAAVEIAPRNGHSHNGAVVMSEGPTKETPIKTVAWMIVVGDGLHNFMDGIAIGAAFSQSLITGISVSLGTFFEELPHELGDFAILLNSGMSLKKALMCNFVSACTCYMGLAMGILLGEMEGVSSWILAATGGIFLYISLVDMLPEVNYMAETEMKEVGKIKVFLIQCAGMLLGYGIMIVLSLLEIYGENETLSVEQLETLFKTLAKKEGGVGHDVSRAGCDNLSSTECLTSKCLTVNEILKANNLENTSRIDHVELTGLSPALLYQAQKDCSQEATETLQEHKPSTAEVWGYGILSVTIINVCALTGICFVGVMKHRFYKRFLMFMVALAVGVLVSSSILVLIPESMHLFTTLTDPHTADVLFWKSTVVLGGIFLFFVVERILKMCLDKSQAGMDTKKHTLAENDPVSSSVHPSRLQETEPNIKLHLDQLVKDDKLTKTESHSSKLALATNEISIVTDAEHNGVSPPSNGYADHSHYTGDLGDDDEKPIKTVAWMIVIGDGIHNFMDGVAIGAAFSENIVTGITISLGIFFEELPHELGDFAILLNSGMSMKKALGFNFLSAITCYLGLCLGILLGGMEDASSWILAVTGGIFLYISLVDMLPEVNVMAETIKDLNKVFIFIIQCAGILVGYGTIIIIVQFAGQIEVTI
ncbi:unnamed protein product [Owenia fusiformis]|uniref:Uncharacterized protein n=1 Tax=Owenia fusiformis TaxID=6347 RepID=A0A8J1U142_OWEFU|nr:unnamed protein product [Owenia fusiformis]